MKSFLAIASASALVLFSAACGQSPTPEVGTTSSAESTATRRGDTKWVSTPKELDGLRAELFNADETPLWYRCETTVGPDAVSIDLVQRNDGGPLHARARYTARDFNWSVADTVVELGAADVAEMIPGPTLHYVFSLTINGKPARLDAGSVWEGTGTLTVGSLSIKMYCGFRDAPWDVGVGSANAPL